MIQLPVIAGGGIAAALLGAFALLIRSFLTHQENTADINKELLGSAVATHTQLLTIARADAAVAREDAAGARMEARTAQDAWRECERRSDRQALQIETLERSVASLQARLDSLAPPKNGEN